MMKSYHYIGVILFVLLFMFSCNSKEKYAERLQDIPSKHLENYQFKSSAFSDRLNISSPMVLEYIRDMDNDPDYKFYEPSDEEKSMLDEYFSLLPGHIQQVCAERLVGIYFIEGFFGSGLTDFVLNEEGEVYTILFLNPVVLKMNLSELLTYKVRSCFKGDEENLQLFIDIPSDFTGLLYILHHETAHIVDYVEGQTPYVHSIMKELGYVTEDSAFIDPYWSDYAVPDDEIALGERKKLHFYSDNEEELISDSEMISYYNDLKRSPFCSLYSSMNWAEDFAEYVTLYSLVNRMKMSYKITIFEKDQVLFEYEPFENPLVQKRISLLDNLFD